MRSCNGDFPPWRCSGRQRRRGERRRHPLGNKPWKKVLHHHDEPWKRSLEGCFNGEKERGRERERGEHEIEGIKEGEKAMKDWYWSGVGGSTVGRWRSLRLVAEEARDWT